MTTFRTFTNRPGITYNADKTEVLFAEDLNQIAEAINTLEVSSEGIVQNLTNVATATPIGISDEHINISALAQNLTIANPSGTLAEGQMLTIRIKPDGTPRTLTFGSKYLGFGATIPTTTVANKKMLLGCIYNAGLDKVELVSVVNES